MKKFIITMVAVAFAASPFVVSAATLTRHLDLGMSGSDVSSLQIFLAKDASVYPSGLVTGYYGQLTKAGIERFQAKNNIVSSGTPATTGYGRVGPLTLATINSQMNGNNTSPAFNSINISTSNTTANLNWNTNENASAVVYYSAFPIPMTEGSATSGVVIGGSSMLVDASPDSRHSTTISSLAPNTTYNYVLYVRDSTGNESVTWPSTFRTSN